MIDEKNIAVIDQLLDKMAAAAEQLEKAIEAKHTREVEKAKKIILELQAQINVQIKGK